MARSSPAASRPWPAGLRRPLRAWRRNDRRCSRPGRGDPGRCGRR